MSHLLVFRVGIIVECKDRRSNATVVVSLRRDVEFNAWGVDDSVGGLQYQSISVRHANRSSAYSIVLIIPTTLRIFTFLAFEDTSVS